MSFTLLSPGQIQQGVFGFISASCKQETCKTGRSTNPEQRLCAGGFAAAGMCWALHSFIQYRLPKLRPRFSASATCFCHLAAVPERLKNGPGEPRWRWKRSGREWGGEKCLGGCFSRNRYLRYSNSFFPSCYRCENETSVPGFAERTADTSRLVSEFISRRGPARARHPQCNAACDTALLGCACLHRPEAKCPPPAAAPAPRGANRCARPPRSGYHCASKGFHTRSSMASFALEWFDLAGDPAPQQSHASASRLAL